jgi:hypothetical protein
MASKQTLTEAFRKFGVEPINRNWSVSAISSSNELVVSCWNHRDYLFKTLDALVYRDRLSRWHGRLGNDKLRAHLIEAWDRTLPIRLIQATPDDPIAARAVIDSGGDASTIKKHFHAREDLIGSFKSFEDRDLFIFEFRKK